MMVSMQYLLRALVCCPALAMLGAGDAASQSAPAKAAPSAKAPIKKKAPVKALPPLPAASAEQIEAAQSVYFGVYECEFKQALEVTASTKFPSYIDVKFGKNTYLSKPVVSATGAIRLEHTLGETLLVQIATKSMLLNLKTGQRMVDDCIGTKQREAIEVAKRAAAEAAALQEAKAAAAAASAPVAASAPIAASAPAAAPAPVAASAPIAASAPAAASAPVAASAPLAPPAAASSPSQSR
jgi:hypothetical protein